MTALNLVSFIERIHYEAYAGVYLPYITFAGFGPKSVQIKIDFFALNRFLFTAVQQRARMQMVEVGVESNEALLITLIDVSKILPKINKIPKKGSNTWRSFTKL